VAILERAGAASAATSAADLAVHQRPGGRVRAWALGRDGSAFAMDEAAVARGVRGAEARLAGDDASALTSASDAQLQLQVGFGLPFLTCDMNMSLAIYVIAQLRPYFTIRCEWGYGANRSRHCPYPSICMKHVQ
jgi:hypothetical protein